MSAIDTLAFDNFDTVASRTGPTLDGFILHDIGLEDPGLVEMGYTRGCRYTWSGGGLPLAIFQGVKKNNTLIFGFFGRFNQEFYEQDKIIIALKENTASPPQNTRRIDINPVYFESGAGGGAVGSEPDIRTNEDPLGISVFKGVVNPGDPLLRWENCSQAITAKVRSWRPPTPATDVGWSVEVTIPMQPGADWITIADDFRLFFSIIHRFDVDGQTFYTSLQFPRDRAKLTGADGPTLEIPASSYGVGRIGTGLGLGVRFRNDFQGIGRLSNPSVSPSTSSGITRVMTRTFNRLVARVENSSLTDTAADISAEFRFGRFGLPPGSDTRQWHDWSQPAGMEPIGIIPKRTVPITLAAGAFGDMTTNWTLTGPEQTDFAAKPHRCMVATLHSTSNVNFTQASVRANTNFDLASEVTREVEVSGEGYEPPADGGDELEMLMFTFARALQGSHLLEVVDVKNGTDATATMIRDLLATVIPAEEQIQETDKTEHLAITPGEWHWRHGQSDEKRFEMKFVGRDGKYRLRIRPPVVFDEFLWEEFDGTFSAGEHFEFSVRPPPDSTERQETQIYYELFYIGLGDERELVAAAAIPLYKLGKAGPPPGMHWQEVLRGSEVVIWTTFGFLRTGKTLKVGGVEGVEGEVLDETPGEFAVVALHWGVRDAVAWSLSGPSYSWEVPGTGRLKVPYKGAAHLDMRLVVEGDGKQGDLGPRHVQPDLLELEWGPEETEPKRVTFDQRREWDGSLVLLLPDARARQDEDFSWKGMREKLSHGSRVEVEVWPPQTFATADRIGELRYRVDQAFKGRGRPETGRVRLVKRGAKRIERKPKDPSWSTRISSWLSSILGVFPRLRRNFWR